MDKQKEQFCCHQTRFLDSKWPTNAFADGAPPYPAGKLTALPRLPSWIKGPLRGMEMEREEGKENASRLQGVQEPVVPHIAFIDRKQAVCFRDDDG